MIVAVTLLLLGTNRKRLRLLGVSDLRLVACSHPPGPPAVSLLDELTYVLRAFAATSTGFPVPLSLAGNRLS